MDDSFFDVKGAQAERDTSIPEFHNHPVYVGKDKTTGIEKYEDRVYVKIMNPGQRDIVDRAVTDDDQRRWPDSWAAFQAGEEAPLNGFPIENWGVIGPADVRMLKSCHIRSVEDLAATPDGNLGRIGPGAVELKKKATRWLLEHESTESLLNRIERLERGENRDGTHSIPAPAQAGDDQIAMVKRLKIELKDAKDRLKKANAKIKELKELNEAS